MKADKHPLQKLGLRLGTTSYIIPADILPNLRFLAGRVDDVELVLFESDEYSNLPSKSDVAEMAGIAAGANLTYTVHLPLDAWPGASDEGVRKNSMGKWLRVMDLMETLNPFAWIVHLNDPPPPSSASKLAAWQEQCAKSLEELSARVDPRLLCVETLSYDYRMAWPMAEANKCSVCLDVGHLVLNHYNVRAYCDAWLPYARVLHVHGVDATGRDHVDLRHLDPAMLGCLLNRLTAENQMPRVITLEMFSRMDMETSMIALERVLS